MPRPRQLLGICCLGGLLAVTGGCRGSAPRTAIIDRPHPREFLTRDGHSPRSSETMPAVTETAPEEMRTRLASHGGGTERSGTASSPENALRLPRTDGGVTPRPFPVPPEAIGSF